MNRYACLTKIFRISDKHDHTPSVEQTAIYIADTYANNEDDNQVYTKELAYIACILAAKLHKQGYYYLQKAAYTLDYDLFALEKQVVIKLNYQLYNHHFLCDVEKVMRMIKCNKVLSVDFLLISRYLSWCNVKANFYTIVLAIHIIKKTLFKFNRVYKLFLLVNQFYDIDIKELVIEYNLLNQNNNDQ